MDMDMNMDIPAGSIPPWTGLDCGCSWYPCFSAAVASNRLSAAPPARIARIIACSQHPARRMEKLPRRHQEVLDAYSLAAMYM